MKFNKKKKQVKSFDLFNFIFKQQGKQTQNRIIYIITRQQNMAHYSSFPFILGILYFIILLQNNNEHKGKNCKTLFRKKTSRIFQKKNNR